MCMVHPRVHHYERVHKGGSQTFKSKVIKYYFQFFLRKMLGTWYESVGTRFFLILGTR